MSMEKIVFLDRDGTISKDSVDHIKSWEEFHFLPKAKKGIALLTKNGFHIIIITNQSVIARKMTTLEGLSRLHTNMMKEIEEAGGKITNIYFCPHHPDDGCNCRKPQPGLLQKAIQENGIDPTKSYMVGDRIMDIQVGKTVGCKTILIANDRGNDELKQSPLKPEYVAKNLVDVARWIIKDFTKNSE
jgi:D-glycero-D-manno-heptose 1,7-bisphosphate phosphatase